MRWIVGRGKVELLRFFWNVRGGASIRIFLEYAAGRPASFVQCDFFALNIGISLDLHLYILQILDLILEMFISDHDLNWIELDLALITNQHGMDVNLLIGNFEFHF